MKRTIITAAAITAAALALGSGPASARVLPASYADTSVSGYFLSPAAITGSAVCTAQLSGGFTVGSLHTNAYGGKVTWSLDPATTLPGVQVAPVGGLVTGTAGYSGTGDIAVDATDQAGDVAVVAEHGVTEVNGALSGFTTGTCDSTDEVGVISLANVGPDVAFSASGSSLAWSEAGLPAGLATGNPLVPGSAAPGWYSGVKVTATDAAGARSSGTFWLHVS